ncbi:hypothetical protein MKEN_00126200 [Mycena kentingensis (nom. inval.)]|nr:hypothetical protein MKEN_00126200 [Mycena kentingensis (nom. inval.)]
MDSFPAELWTMVLSNVPRKDLFSVRLASRRFVHVAEPILFTELVLYPYYLERLRFWSTGIRARCVRHCCFYGRDADDRWMAAFLEALPRFTGLKSLALLEVRDTPVLFNTIAQLPHLCRVENLGSCPDRRVESEPNSWIPPQSLNIQLFKSVETRWGALDPWITSLSPHTLTLLVIDTSIISSLLRVSQPFRMVKLFHVYERSVDESAITVLDAARMLALVPAADDISLPRTADSELSAEADFEVHMPSLNKFSGRVKTLVAIPGLLESALPALTTLTVAWYDLNASSVRPPALKTLRVWVETSIITAMVAIAMTTTPQRVAVYAAGFFNALIAFPGSAFPASIRAVEMTFRGYMIPTSHSPDEEANPPVFPDPRPLRRAFPMVEQFWIDDKFHSILYSWVKGSTEDKNVELYYRRFEDPEGSEAKEEYERRGVSGWEEYWKQAEAVWKELNPDLEDSE